MSNPILDSPGTLKPILRLALPVLVEQLFFALVWVSDRVLTGHYLDTPHLAAVTLMAYVLWFLTGLFSVVSISGTAMVARFVGAGHPRMARRVTNQAVLLGAAMAVVATTGAYFGRELIVDLLQLEGKSAELAIEYLTLIVPVLPLVMLEMVGIACLRGAGDMISGVLIMILVNLTNIAVSWALVLGVGPFPEMGWAGVALGTAVGFALGGVLVSLLLLRGRVGLSLRWRLLRPSRNLLARLLRIGLPAGADMMSLIGCQLWFVAVINQLGDLATAAHGTAITAESLAFLPGSAFSVAVTTAVGQYLGAGDPRRAGRSVWSAFLVGGGVMVAAGIGFLVFSDSLPRLLVAEHQQHVAVRASVLLRWIAMAMPALASVMILNGALRGAGDTRWPMIVTLVGLLGVRIPLAYWLAFGELYIPGLAWTVTGCDLGVTGAWIAMVIDLWVRASLTAYRFIDGRWKEVQV